ncbi:MAG: peptidyl-prolyl cis-trans isomerase [Planctomycetes bacterium]|nr:peptidyl-prolyl cis-trans isomerase [Planctomycetota bacterium]
MTSLAFAAALLLCQDPIPPPPALPAPVAGAPAEGAAPPAARTAAPQGQPLDSNFVLAAVNNEIVTIRDVLLEWRLDSRRNADPDRPAAPRTPEEQMQEAKKIVIDRLWLAHAKSFPMYGEIVTRKLLDEEARDMWGSLWSDPAIPVDERELMLRKAESRIALQLALQSDPEFRRCSVARPDDVRRFWENNPELHKVPPRVELGRVLLGREVHGAGVEAKAAALRQLAIERSSLETAAAELAPGDFSRIRIDDLDHEESLRADVLAFARSAEPGELSAPVVGSASVMLFTVLRREPGREIAFEDAAPKIKEILQNGRCDYRAKQYFVVRILAESYFGPADLFDDEIEQLIPGTKERRARASRAEPPGN